MITLSDSPQHPSPVAESPREKTQTERETEREAERLRECYRQALIDLERIGLLRPFGMI